MRSHYDFSNAIVGKYFGKVDTKDTPTTRLQWRNPSVKLLARRGDPLEVVVEDARALVLKAADAGVLSIPIDPFKLAELKSIQVIPRTDVPDAQLRREGGKDVIVYNPTRGSHRIRFSICHELGHSLFEDWAQQVRNRLPFHSRTSPIDYELEALCNLAAAEFLMPLGSMKEDMAKLKLSVETALQLSPKYEASAEAVLLRLAGLSGTRCAAFAAAPEGDASDRRYRLEYVKGPRSWDPGVRRGDLLPADSVVKECTGIRFTAARQEEWVPGQDKMSVEAVGVAPYPNRYRDPDKKVMPRVAGLIRPAGPEPQEGSPIRFLRGDALDPRGPGPKIVAHVVNDKTPRWGAGFGLAVQKKWPQVQRQFEAAFSGMTGSKLGRTAISRVTDDLYAFQMICQRGYASSGTLLRYEALRECLAQLRDTAITKKASVHMPRIGSGEARGSWALIENLISEELCARGVSVTVYDLPSGRRRLQQSDLFDESTH
jgi:Zn-dependent peptidase ImmA (M78 family)